MADLPAQVEIGPLVYRVSDNEDTLHRLERLTQCHNLAGAVRYDEEQLIALDPKNTKARQRVTLFHEIHHAIDNQIHIEDMKVDDENYVRAFSFLWVDTMRRNPALVAFLVGE